LKEEGLGAMQGSIWYIFLKVRRSEKMPLISHINKCRNHELKQKEG